MATTGTSTNRVLSIVFAAQDLMTPTITKIGAAIKSIGASFAHTIGHVMMLPVHALQKALHFLLDPLSLIRNLIVIELAHKVLEFAEQAAELAHQIESLSLKLGTSVEKIQQFQFIAKQSGTTMDSLSTEFVKLGKAISEATESAGGKGAKALHDLGLSASALAKLDPVDQFEKIAEAMSNVTNQGDRLRLAIALMGRGGAEALKVFALTSEQLRAMKADAESLNGVLSEGTIITLAGVAKAVARMTTAINGARSLLVEAIAPIVTKVVNQIADGIAKLSRKVANLLAAVVAAFSGGEIGEKARRAFEGLGGQVNEFGLVLGEEFIKGFGVAVIGAIDTLAVPLGNALIHSMGFAFARMTTWMVAQFGKLPGIGDAARKWADQANFALDVLESIGTVQRDFLNEVEQGAADSSKIAAEMIIRSWERLGDTSKSLLASLEKIGAVGAESLEAIRVAAEGAGHEIAKAVEKTSEWTLLWGGFGDAAKAAWKSLQDSAQLGVTMFNNAFGEWTQGIDGMVDSAFEGTLNIATAFRDMAKNIIREITKILIRWAAVQIAMSFFGGPQSDAGAPGSTGTGSVLPSALGNAFNRGRLIPLAAGGIVTRPTIFPMARGMGLMGESGPEAVMPLGRDRSGRLGVRGSGGDTHITIHAVDARSFQDLLSSGDSQRTVKMIVERLVHNQSTTREAIRKVR